MLSQVVSSVYVCIFSPLGNIRVVFYSRGGLKFNSLMIVTYLEAQKVFYLLTAADRGKRTQ